MSKTEKIKALTKTLTNKNELNTFGGVFTPTILTILGVIMFMRANFVVGEAGILGSILILCLATSITFLTSLSISAIATNMQVRGGGSYFLISRVLGPEFGGAIGLSLFLATALSAPFYIIGFIEALTLTFPFLEAWSLYIGLFIAITIFTVAFVGAQWALKIQYIIMSILLLAIVTFFAGTMTHFSSDIFAQNWASDFSLIQSEPSSDTSGHYFSFWLIFAIYFPAVTGIDAGLNMSGDLKDATKSIPKGTLIAIGVGFLVYLIQILLSGGAYERALLKEQPFQLLVDNALFGFGFLVIAGVFAATLSSALGSTLGAPRVLQALARDPILSVLKPFSKGSEKGDEPQRALFFTAVITILVLCWAYMSSGGDALNAIASIITMFFLYTYGMINLAAFTEAFGNNPSFRPRFKFFHWITALLGGIGCVFAAFLINAFAAIVAAIAISILILFLKNKQTKASFGDARRGFVYASARKNLIQLSEMEEDAKNWRPTMLVFSGNPNTREGLVTYATWLSSGRGIVFLADILLGKFKEIIKHRKSALKRLKEFCREKNIRAFPLVLVEETVEKGISNILQTAGSGLITPNMALLGWCDDRENLKPFFRQLRLIKETGLSLVLVKTDELPFPWKEKNIHIWWRGKENGTLMIILGYLLKDNWEWNKSQIKVLRSVDEKAGKTPALNSLNDLIEEARIDATAEVVFSQEPFKNTLKKYSSNTDCLFLGFNIPKEGEEESWYAFYSELLNEMPTTLLINSDFSDAEGLLD